MILQYVLTVETLWSRDIKIQHQAYISTSTFLKTMVQQNCCWLFFFTATSEIELPQGWRGSCGRGRGAPGSWSCSDRTPAHAPHHEQTRWAPRLERLEWEGGSPLTSERARWERLRTVVPLPFEPASSTAFSSVSLVMALLLHRRRRGSEVIARSLRCLCWWPNGAPFFFKLNLTARWRR